jgi:hypothetical protein
VAQVQVQGPEFKPQPCRQKSQCFPSQGCSSGIEHLASTLKALGSIPSAHRDTCTHTLMHTQSTFLMKVCGTDARFADLWSRQSTDHRSDPQLASHTISSHPTKKVLLSPEQVRTSLPSSRNKVTKLQFIHTCAHTNMYTHNLWVVQIFSLSKCFLKQTVMPQRTPVQKHPGFGHWIASSPLYPLVSILPTSVLDLDIVVPCAVPKAKSVSLSTNSDTRSYIVMN